MRCRPDNVMCLVLQMVKLRHKLNGVVWRKVRSDLDIKHYLSESLEPSFARVSGMVTYKILSSTIIT